MSNSRVAGIAGLLAAVLMLAGSYLSGLGSGIPARDADAAAWSAWASHQEGPVELGVYVLLFPGLVLFLLMASALIGRLPSRSMWTRVAGYGAVSFFVLFASGAALASASPSAYGFYAAFDDPTALAALAAATAGYHFQALGVWTLALTMLATTLALRSSGEISSRLTIASVGLAVLAAAGNVIGFGVVFGLIWIAGVGVSLARVQPGEPSPATVD